MAIYLNTNIPLENYKELCRKKYMVDKSLIIEKLNDLIGISDKYICITRPRRFGKTSIIDMLGAYYTKTVDSKDLFDKLNISTTDDYLKHLNKYNVISISFNKISDKGNTFFEYMNMIKTSLINDIVEKYPHINPNKYFTISDMLNDTNEKFIFIMDEWDYIFNNNLFIDHQNEFLEFLRNLLKEIKSFQYLW